jgi:hypothetical protein
VSLTSKDLDAIRQIVEIAIGPLRHDITVGFTATAEAFANQEDELDAIKKRLTRLEIKLIR